MNTGTIEISCGNPDIAHIMDIRKLITQVFRHRRRIIGGMGIRLGFRRDIGTRTGGMGIRLGFRLDTGCTRAIRTLWPGDAITDTPRWTEACSIIDHTPIRMKVEI